MTTDHFFSNLELIVTTAWPVTLLVVFGLVVLTVTNMKRR